MAWRGKSRRRRPDPATMGQDPHPPEIIDELPNPLPVTVAELEVYQRLARSILGRIDGKPLHRRKTTTKR